MDAMALLCNLHADGPTTLKSLRDGGCSSLDELAALPVERLVALLGFTPAAARRFLREGASLRERLGGELLESEEELQVPAVSAAPCLATAETGRLPLREQELLARVMRRWREEDHAAEAAGSNGTNHAATASSVAEAPDAGNGRAARVPQEDALAPGALDGLDEELCRKLAHAGVTSLAQLASCVPEEVAAASGLAYSRVRRAQFLARRRSDRGELTPFPPPAGRELPEEKISLAFPVRPLGASQPTPLFEREMPGGPFA